MTGLKLIATASELEMIYSILSRHLPSHELWAFGSRVEGSVKKFSDLDLPVIGDQPLPISTTAALSEDFTESDLPYKVDIVDWSTTGEEFRARIAAAHVTLQHADGSVPIVELA